MTLCYFFWSYPSKLKGTNEVCVLDKPIENQHILLLGCFTLLIFFFLLTYLLFLRSTIRQIGGFDFHVIKAFFGMQASLLGFFF